MLHGKRIVVVLPAYKAELTLEKTFREIPGEVDEVLLVDDASTDRTLELARRLGIRAFGHPHNQGYGANQKTCYREALRAGADVVVMLHPDYQYDPRLVTAMAAMVASDVYDVVLGSRLLGNTVRSGGMPYYKYVANRCLTALQNRLMGITLSEYHTGYRAFSRTVLERLPLAANSDDFVFDNQMLAQAAAFRYRIGEISCPTRYLPEASSIGFWRACVYGLGVVRTTVTYALWRCRLLRPRIFADDPQLRLLSDTSAPPA